LKEAGIWPINEALYIEEGSDPVRFRPPLAIPLSSTLRAVGRCRAIQHAFHGTFAHGEIKLPPQGLQKAGS